MIRLTDRKRHNRQGWVLGSAAGELRAVRDEKVRNIMGLALFVDNSVTWIFRHPIGAQIMGRKIGRGRQNPCCANRLIDIMTALIGMVSHRHIIGVGSVAQIVRDSLCDSKVLVGLHEQTYIPDLWHNELAFLQFCPEAAWFAADLV